MRALKFDFGSRMDASLNAFFSGQLEQVRAQLYEKKYPEFKARKFVPIKNDIHPGAEVLTERSIDEAGEAEYVEDLANDAPLVEITGASSDSYKMRMIQIAYAWHLQEARNAIFAGTDLSSRKAFAARRAIERFIDKNLLIGGKTGGLTLQGLFTLSGAQAPVAFAHPDVAADLESEDPDTIARAMLEFINSVYVESNEIEIPDTMILPARTKQTLMTRRMGDGSNVSILKYVLESQDFIKNVETSHYLEKNGGHGGGNKRRLVVYKKDPENLEGLVNEFEQLPPEYKGARVVTTCLARVGGVAARRPKSIAYWDVTAPA